MGYKWCNNEYKIFPKGIAGIVDKNGNVAYVDVCELDKVYNYTFCKDRHGYFKTGTSDKKYIPLHDIIIGDYDHTKFVVDHINRCKLDNRKCNLRLVTQKQNCLNQKLRSTNKTSFNGVGYDKTRNKYIAYYGKKRIGRFETMSEAIKAREDYEVWAETI